MEIDNNLKKLGAAYEAVGNQGIDSEIRLNDMQQEGKMFDI